MKYYLLSMILLFPFLANCNSGEPSKRLVILIGISSYKDSIIAQTSAATDLYEIKDNYQSKMMVDQFITLVDKEATRENILNLFNNELASMDLSDTHIDILFGGHGHVADAIEYFIPYDGILDVAESLLDVTNEILPLLNKIDFSVCLMMTDICRTPVRGSTKSHPVVPPRIDKNKRQFFFIRSAGPKQFAHEMPRRFGVFSYFFSKLLVDRDFQIEADVDDSGYLSVMEVHAFLQRHTRSWVETNWGAKSRQVPEMLIAEGTNAFFMKIENPNTIQNSGEEDTYVDNDPVNDPIDGATVLGYGGRSTKGDHIEIAEANGCLVMFDIGKWFTMPVYKPLALIFTDNQHFSWSQRTKHELFYSAELVTLVDPSGLFQAIGYNIHMPSKSLENEVLDIKYFKEKERDKYYLFLKEYLQKGTVNSPDIILLERNEFHITNIRILRGYRKVETLSEVISGIIQ